MSTIGENRKSILGFFCFIPLFAAAGLLIASAAATYQRNEVWRTPLRLWTDTALKSPRKSRPFNSLGTVYANQGAYAVAIGKFQIAIANNSGSQEIHHLNLALAYEGLGKIQEAIRALHTSISIKPDHAKAHYHLGLIYKNTGDLTMAETEFSKAVSLAPGDDAYHNALGNIYLLRKKYILSCEQYEKSLKSNPANMEALFNLALSFDESGNKDLAIRHYRQFIERAPADYEFIKMRAKQRIAVLTPRS